MSKNTEINPETPADKAVNSTDLLANLKAENLMLRENLEMMVHENREYSTQVHCREGLDYYGNKSSSWENVALIIFS